ncbi:MAG: AAA family ATPase, partial [Myxococcota bacterium]
MNGTVFGREAELVEVDATLADAREGFAALVLEGDPGIGKTTVWRRGMARAADQGCRVLSCRAVSAEAKLSFAALGDLLAPIEPAVFDALPGPQRRALDAALLRKDEEGVAPNPRAIGTGIVTLLSTLAAAAPVVLAVDDVQWLDLPSARALEFALRRLEARPVAVLATRRLGVESTGSGLLATGERVRALRVGPLSIAALYRIVEERLGKKLPRPVLVRIERASGGNPFFALEIARALAAHGSPAAGENLPIPDDLSQLVTERLRKLPQRTRDALLRASALAQPTLALVDAAALAPAEEAGIVRLGSD